MARGEQPGVPRVRPGALAWLSPQQRAMVERVVFAAIGKPWRIHEELDYSEFACHPCAVLRGEGGSVFLKYSDAADARRQFDVEVAGLTALAECADTPVPRHVGIASVRSGAFLIMEALEPVERRRLQWADIGRLLATIHRVHGASFGYAEDGFWGSLPLDNTPSADWATFFRQRRLHPLRRHAIDSGHLPVDMAKNVDAIEARLSELCGPDPSPTLLHGDAQGNNFVSTVSGAYAIDPAVYFGHPEMDLAAIDLWQPAPDAALQAYREEASVDRGFEARRDLWRIPAYLAAVALEGSAYLRPLADAMRPYL